MPSDWASLMELRLARLSVPEHSIEPTGMETGKPWTPEDEQPRPGLCPKCLDAIASGSLAFCPKCQASGFDQKLMEQRILVPSPLPERLARPDRLAKPKQESKKKRAGRPRKQSL